MIECAPGGERDRLDVLVFNVLGIIFDGKLYIFTRAVQRLQRKRRFFLSLLPLAAISDLQFCDIGHIEGSLHGALVLRHDQKLR